MTVLNSDVDGKVAKLIRKERRKGGEKRRKKSKDAEQKPKENRFPIYKRYNISQEGSSS